MNLRDVADHARFRMRTVAYHEAIAEVGVPLILFQLQPALGGVNFDPETNTCGLRGVCRLPRVLGDAMKAFYASLDQYSLADIAIPAPKLQATLHWHHG